MDGQTDNVIVPIADPNAMQFNRLISNNQEEEIVCIIAVPVAAASVIIMSSMWSTHAEKICNIGTT